MTQYQIRDETLTIDMQCISVTPTEFNFIEEILIFAFSLTIIIFFITVLLIKAFDLLQVIVNYLFITLTWGAVQCDFVKDQVYAFWEVNKILKYSDPNACYTTLNISCISEFSHENNFNN